MAIITISRGSLSGGANLAQMTAEALNCECISRELLLESASAAYGLDPKELADALEKPPSLWERITKGRRVYLKILKAALLEHACSGELIYHGHAGHFLLQDLKCVLKVRLIAPMESRIRAAMELKQMSREEAESHIRSIDEIRTRWTKYLYNVDWCDPINFDLVLNLDVMKMNTAKDLICLAVQKTEFKICKSGAMIINNIVLSAKVAAHLAIHKETETLDLDISADDGVVRLKGDIESQKLQPLIMDIVKSVPGVKSIHDELAVKSISPIPT
ncbi:MAG: cytidylate kinase family protein [Candidatus Omnitrophica bacterium]|nr:cytidylate kinase family protein [Candidatus Omnitrophota bacterium]